MGCIKIKHIQDLDYIVRKIIQDIVKNVDFGEELLINDKIG